MKDAHEGPSEIIILTGMSGSGKSKAADYLEDMGFLCVDNLPPQVLHSLIHTFTEGPGGEGLGIRRMAFVIDVRSAELFSGMQAALDDLDRRGLGYRIIFLDCRDHELISRYKQSRRNHPLAGRRGIAAGIQAERRLLEPLRHLADVVLDTTGQPVSQLREQMYRIIADDGQGLETRMSVLVQSFGFKYGVPPDSDLVLDVRFIPNPFYVPELRPMSGQDAAVARFVLDTPETETFIEKQLELLTFTLPLYVREGKVRLNIAVGCTGGRHRSVAVATELARRLRQARYRVVVDHRDIALDLPLQGADDPEDDAAFEARSRAVTRARETARDAAAPECGSADTKDAEPGASRAPGAEVAP